ncbi:hypothetical protein DSO57_1038786 [Entomophthora muscae]|uniref:Uncharacterized protein n=1 Tax=Entomophthora muscae TaxID=34485 RepID=A0ACC2SMN4_9FUNG|nr:hypothetical protein DSO57_1038786 [Entomophthora muscae]
METKYMPSGLSEALKPTIKLNDSHQSLLLPKNGYRIKTRNDNVPLEYPAPRTRSKVLPSDSSHRYPNGNDISLTPLRMPATVGLSPLDALRAKAEAELKKTTPSQPKKLSMNWSKDMESITHDLKLLETTIGVDKNQSIAHFRNTASPLPPLQPLETCAVPRNTPKNRQRTVPTFPLSPPDKCSSVRNSSSSADPPSTSSAHLSLPSFSQSSPRTSNSSLSSPDSLYKELAWERRQRFLLEVRLSEEKEVTILLLVATLLFIHLKHTIYNLL